MSQAPPPVPSQRPDPPPPGTTQQATYAPQQPGYAPPPAGVDLRTIAVRQWAVMYCILGYVAMFLAQFAFPPDVRFVPMLLAFAVSIAASFFLFMCSVALYNTGTGIVLGVLTLLPFVSMIVLLVIIGKATNVLRSHSIRVGLLGAPAGQIPAPGTVPYR